MNQLLRTEIEANKSKIVVLDDDPTGVQTVHGVSVYTDWSEESIEKGFLEDRKLFYILTNSRSMSSDETEQVHRKIARRIVKVSQKTGKDFILMSRSDSTLRGHYPLETETLRQELELAGKHIDGEILSPFFKEGGRFTIGNIHYVKLGDRLVPAAETEFARDKSFGYTKSSIPEYIEEKTNGRYKAEDVVCISLEDLRSGDVDVVESKLLSLTDFGKVCLNAEDYDDLEMFSIAFYRALSKGKNYIFRTAAGEVKVLGGISDRPLLTREEMIVQENDNGGIVVVGSHTEMTTRQLEELLNAGLAEPVEFNSDKVLEGDEALYSEVERCVAEEERIIKSGKTAVCYTKRKLLSLEGDTAETALMRSVKISDAVQKLVGGLKITPSFIIAKGGITSSDIGTKALGVKRAEVMGQIRPGIPVWQTGPESKFPLIPYIIFPGNTGDENDLKKAVEIVL